MCTLAWSHGTSSPFIQMLEVGVIGMGLILPVRCSVVRCGSDGGGEAVADLGGGLWICRHVRARLADALGGVGLPEELEHHRGAEHRGGGVGLVLAGDVGGGAVD